MKLILAALAGFLPALSDAPSAAQERIILVQAQQRQDGAVRVQSSINFFVPGPAGESEEAEKVRDRARRLIYGIAYRECDLLREVLAKDCRLESVTANLNRQTGQQLEGYMVNGSMSFQITLK